MEDWEHYILLFDSDHTNQEKVKESLANLNVEVIIADCIADVADLVLLYDFALILLAVDTSNFDIVFDLTTKLNQNEQTRYVPVIFQASSEDIEELTEKGYAAGGIDFLRKPLRPVVFKAKVRLFLELDDRQRQLAHASSKIQEQNLKLEERATRDGLTGLYNHNYLQEQLCQEVARARRYSTPLSVFMLDLDFFKDVNDSCGHPFGDFVLNEFAQRVKKGLRQSDIFGRYGGEEFMVILPSTNSRKAAIVAEKVRQIVSSKPFSNNRYERYVTVSIGVYSGFGENIADVRTIIDNVDNSLYQAKAEGRNRVVEYHTPSGSAITPGSQNFQDMIDSSHQSRLNTTIDKARAMTLASFEAMVHSQTREYDILVERNTLFAKVLDGLAARLNLPEQLVHSFKRAIKLHDLFRCYIHDSSLETTGPLNDEQKNMLFDQPLMLHELTTMFDFFASERVILYSHHERYDGTGYPDGLKEHEIPMGSRIFSLVDAYIAMIAPVNKDTKMNIEQARQELKSCSGSQFDPFLVNMLLQIIDSDSRPDNIKEGTDALQRSQ